MRPAAGVAVLLLACAPLEARADQRNFVADPAKGSRHNRGCAVDLTLYRLSDGRTVEMPSGASTRS